ncbi:hypothetical protein CRG98_008357 [Punica granatum]|uniref:Reverse transcriptase Ty1/copia-type domain-containing protein n=1 Tax=Punica granatum TaxID=22663 RepID=A0A2I0KS01_PUNGR|nr:hypothetical protein CRG98_008357 [Punica granatum]
MTKKMESLWKNQTRELVKPPKNQKIVRVQLGLQEGGNLGRKEFKSRKEIDMMKSQLNGEFEMKDLGAAMKILGMEICKDRVARTLFLSQKGYIEKVLQQFNYASSSRLVRLLLRTLVYLLLCHHPLMRRLSACRGFPMLVW